MVVILTPIVLVILVVVESQGVYIFMGVSKKLAYPKMDGL